MADEAAILKALESVSGPGGKSIVAAGLVSGINVSGGKVFVSLSGDPARAKELEVLAVAVEGAVKTVPGVEAAIVTLTAEKAPAPAAPPPGQAPQRKPIAAIEKIKYIVAVSSGKGGVGKSTTSANLALGLSALGWRVGLLDADIFGPSAPRLFGLGGQKPEVVDNRLVPLEAYGVKVMSIGFLVDEDVPMIWRGPMVVQALGQLLGEVAWGELDALVVDMPPGTGDVQLTMAQQVPLAGAVVVSTPQDLALIDARRGVAMFQRVETPILGVVENMSYFLCPHCGGRTDIFSHGGARQDAEALGVPFLGEVPLDLAIRETSDAGTPVVATDPKGKYAAVYIDLAEKVKTALETRTRRAPPKIVVG
ncbi:MULTISPECIES: Mrp/NBP35 family ATP-binding protein [Methylosinus]|uniref:Iron-sulfur cluster carrier protein n=1 Tax=Methylosinus trichosporium (strain ATCC 35070 / NCIMB 11131 / UNIQEM 75 / OB3b) TaxID=595536 RepID=A0A2D2CVV3_METT3|nr:MULTISPECIES: Mrp/NBP35 family ATP-binding protein [Methylosinus]ATQ66786.1 iron-sulfur cluster carrier protein ApbC [Methylosinus trichosporium OB3b]OBS54195.1 sodium:proton antiporter [Methylosinus sp. 3S-1]